MKTSTRIIIFLLGIIGGLLFLHFNLIKRYVEKSSQIEYKTVYVENRDTVYFEKPIIHWKTKTKTDTIFLNNLSSNALKSDSLIIYQTPENNELDETICNEDSFYFSTFHKDSILVANIYVEGRGVPTKTFIDSVSMDYKFTYPKTEIIIKKKCNFWRRIFCGCE